MVTVLRPHRQRKLSREEHALWQGVIRSVAPLNGTKVAPEVLSAEPAAENPAAEKSGHPKRPPSKPVVLPSHVAPPLAPLERRQKRQLVRGTAEIDARLDLHGRTQAQAYAALLRFLQRAQAEGARMVLVVTGKGRAGEGLERGVLRRQVPLWLALPEFRLHVQGFEAAHVVHGGEGALYVRLRRMRTRRFP